MALPRVFQSTRGIALKYSSAIHIYLKHQHTSKDSTTTNSNMQNTHIARKSQPRKTHTYQHSQALPQSEQLITNEQIPMSQKHNLLYCKTKSNESLIPQRQSKLKMAGLAYVDDTDLVSSGREKTERHKFSHLIKMART